MCNIQQIKFWCSFFIAFFFTNIAHAIKCNESGVPKSIEKLTNCEGEKNGEIIQVSSYFEQKTPFDKNPINLIWKSNETKNDGCLNFKNIKGNGSWVRETNNRNNLVFELPLEFCGLKFMSKKNYSDATNAFVNAFALLKSLNKKSILKIPQGSLYVKPDYDSNIFLFVPTNVSIEGAHETSTRRNTSNIYWDNADIPVFNFIGSNYSGMKYLNFIFEGYLKLSSKIKSMPDYFKKINFDTNHFDNPKQLQTVIFTINSSYLSFDKLSFSSSFQSNDLKKKNERNIPFAITSLGSDPVPYLEGGGLRKLSVGNRFTNIYLRDYVMGFLLSGQENCEIYNITSSGRGDWTKDFPGPPGHVIYVTPPRFYYGNPKNMRYFNSKMIKISNIKETSDNIYIDRTMPSFALGTLALKGVDGGIIKNVISNHPVGILQSGSLLKNITIENITWSFFGNSCDFRDKCDSATNVINIITFEDQNNENLVLNNIKLESPNQPSWVGINGHLNKANKVFYSNKNFIIKNLYIKAADRNLKESNPTNSWREYYRPVVSSQLENSNVNFQYTPTEPDKKYSEKFSKYIRKPLRALSKSPNSNFYITLKNAPNQYREDSNLFSMFEESNEGAPFIGTNESKNSKIQFYLNE
jgi:hypothetical protein